MKFLFKYLLSANYSFAKRWVNKKMAHSMIFNSTYIFLTPFAFLFAGLSCVALNYIDYQFKFPEIILMMTAGIVYLGFWQATKKAIYKWGIEKAYKNLSKEQRSKRNTFAFLFFWVGIILFFYLGAKYLGGYSLR
ncbi:hypothetical protein [Labilibaculum sp. K2S]|uniref:hypothetical protein n=1 Tax=Labilibaculum sp. K2S TaxID=3056386 RepID=UPI0025A40BE2|nr:hypothetical protein [Labilibaculum sp. K2S]